MACSSIQFTSAGWVPVLFKHRLLTFLLVFTQFYLLFHSPPHSLPAAGRRFSRRPHNNRGRNLPEHLLSQPPPPPQQQQQQQQQQQPPYHYQTTAFWVPTSVLPTGPISNRQPFQVRSGPGMHGANNMYGKTAGGRPVVPVPILLADRENSNAVANGASNIAQTGTGGQANRKQISGGSSNRAKNCRGAGSISPPPLPPPPAPLQHDWQQQKQQKRSQQPTLQQRARCTTRCGNAPKTTPILTTSYPHPHHRQQRQQQQHQFHQQDEPRVSAAQKEHQRKQASLQTQQARRQKNVQNGLAKRQSRIVSASSNSSHRHPLAIQTNAALAQQCRRLAAAPPSTVSSVSPPVPPSANIAPLHRAKQLSSLSHGKVPLPAALDIACPLSATAPLFHKAGGVTMRAMTMIHGSSSISTTVNTMITASTVARSSFTGTSGSRGVVPPYNSSEQLRVAKTSRMPFARSDEPLLSLLPASSSTSSPPVLPLGGEHDDGSALRTSLEYEPAKPSKIRSFSSLPSSSCSTLASSVTLADAEQRTWQKTPRKEAPPRALDDDDLVFSSSYSSGSADNAEIVKQCAEPVGSYFSTSPASYLKEKRKRQRLMCVSKDSALHSH